MYDSVQLSNKTADCYWKNCDVFSATDAIFGRPFVKQFAICYRTVVCLSVCDVGVLWPKGGMDQDETCHGGRPRPRQLCVRWQSSSPKMGTAPKFSAHVYCGQMAGWIKMSIGT